MTEVSNVRATSSLSPWFHWLSHAPCWPQAGEKKGGFNSAVLFLTLIWPLVKHLFILQMQAFHHDRLLALNSPQINTGLGSGNVTPGWPLQWGVHRSKASDAQVPLFSTLDPWWQGLSFMIWHEVKRKGWTWVFVCHRYGWECVCVSQRNTLQYYLCFSVL